MAKIDNEIDALYLYDPFSHMVWMALERWGFCGAGEGAALIREQGMDIDSPLPINTHGGLLGSELGMSEPGGALFTQAL